MRIECIIFDASNKEKTFTLTASHLRPCIMKKQSTSLEIVATIVRGCGMWQHPIAVEKALCEDGKRRKVRLNQDGETGRCTIGKKTLKGFVSYIGNRSCGDKEDYQFIAYSDQSN